MLKDLEFFKYFSDAVFTSIVGYNLFIAKQPTGSAAFIRFSIIELINTWNAVSKVHKNTSLLP